MENTSDPSRFDEKARVQIICLWMATEFKPKGVTWITEDEMWINQRLNQPLSTSYPHKIHTLLPTPSTFLRIKKIKHGKGGIEFSTLSTSPTNTTTATTTTKKKKIEFGFKISEGVFF